MKLNAAGFYKIWNILRIIALGVLVAWALFSFLWSHVIDIHPIVPEEIEILYPTEESIEKKVYGREWPSIDTSEIDPAVDKIHFDERRYQLGYWVKVWEF